MQQRLQELLRQLREPPASTSCQCHSLNPGRKRPASEAFGDGDTVNTGPTVHTPADAGVCAAAGQVHVAVEEEQQQQQCTCNNAPGEGWTRLVDGWEQRHIAPEASRGQPCPCGSGHKYKKCCLGVRELPDRPSPFTARSWTRFGLDMAMLLLEKAWEYLEREPFTLDDAGVVDGLMKKILEQAIEVTVHDWDIEGPGEVDRLYIVLEMHYIRRSCQVERLQVL